MNYDRIGRTYAATRRPDPRLAAMLTAALGEGESLVNVGAGTGSYEPGDRRVVAVEPSAVMIRQRRPGAAAAVQAAAERLPFGDGAFDAAMAVLTIHHWRDWRRGLAEMRRVASRRVVVLTWDQAVSESFWLLRDYFPGIAVTDRRRAVPVAEIATAVGGARIEPFAVPHDCVDGFLGAFWRRPQAYLDDAVRGGISSFPLLSADEIERGSAALATDLDSGEWQRRHADLLTRATLDVGYRLIVAG